MESFVGIDLAWSSRQPSGIAVLAPTSRGLRVRHLGLARSLDELMAVVSAHLAPRTVVMVDAPLWVPNVTGRRPCEAAVAAAFHREHAGPYPGNRTLLGRGQPGGAPRGEQLGERLAELRFEWPPRALPRRVPKRARLVHECYPHPAHVRLFGLSRVFAYKRRPDRSWASLRAEYARYRDALLALRRPRIVLDAAHEALLEPRGLSGRAYKDAEDRLDALCCAYLAALLPAGRLEAFGEPASGLLVVPRSR